MYSFFFLYANYIEHVYIQAWNIFQNLKYAQNLLRHLLLLSVIIIVPWPLGVVIRSSLSYADRRARQMCLHHWS